jgi:4-amino-4-deoxy-L-arabinose transferase-like glycosyltransferase
MSHPSASSHLSISRDHSRRFLIILFILAFAIRAYFWAGHAVVLENEGAGYARQADNLLHGRPFEGIVPGVDVVETWLYPLAIAGVTLVIRNSEAATRLVSLIAGSCLILPMYFLALRLYGRKTAWIAAILVAVYPLLIALSVAGYTEGPNLTLMICAIYWAICMLEGVPGRAWLFAGIFIGLAYLNRTEMLAFLPLTIAAVLIVAYLNKSDLKKASLDSLRLLAVFAILAAPYIGFLWKYTGHFRLEGKNLVNYTIGQRELAGMSQAEASRGIDENLNVTGPLLDQNRFATYSPYSRTPRDVLRYFVKMASLKKYWVYRDVLTSFALGSLVLWFVAGLGLLAVPWNRERFFAEAYLIIAMIYFVVILLASHARFERYTFALLPIALLWFSRGVVAIWDWAEKTMAALQPAAPLRAKWVGVVVAAIPMVLVLFASLSGTRDVNELATGRAEYLPLKKAGLWLRDARPAPKNIFSSSVVAYYAGADQWLYPYADGSLALRYIRAKRPDYLVIEPGTGVATPYLAEWAANGVPDADAKMVYSEDSELGRTVIYQWTQ